MTVRDLLEGVNAYKIIGGQDITIKQLYFDSRISVDCGMYFALCGESFDGHDFAHIARQNGACAVVCSRQLSLDVTQIIVEDTREAMAQISANFYGKPHQKLKIIGVTGTNGKTTTTYLIKSILNAAGYSTGIIGTSGCFIKDKYLPTMLTTPDSIELFKLLGIMAAENIEYAVMEVSAHALALKKVLPITFDTGVFTNLSQDHLDFFISMENYKNAKKKLFLQCKSAAINTDDSCGKEIYSASKNAVSYGMENAGITATHINYTDCGISYTANFKEKKLSIKSSLYGMFNVYNTLAAAAACIVSGIDDKYIIEGIKNLKEIKGRFNVITAEKGFKVIIDYAHTPDGVKNVLQCAKKLCARKLICVFGCGGNRDSTKRAHMGCIASEIADFCVLTSDNPRFEQPLAIIKDIQKGIAGQNYIEIENRKRALHYALLLAREGDIIAVLGKGAEMYQEIAGVKYPYNDYDTVNNILKSINT